MYLPTNNIIYYILYNFQSLETVSQSALGLTTIAIYIILYYIMYLILT